MSARAPTTGWPRRIAHAAYTHLWRLKGAGTLTDLLGSRRPPLTQSFHVRLWGGDVIEVPGERVGVPAALWRRGVYEVLTTTLLCGLARGACVYDIGANIGYFSVIAASHGARCIVCVEPYGPNHRLLERNLEGSSAEIRLFECALGREHGEIELYDGAGWGDGSVSAAPVTSSKIVARVTVEAGDVLVKDHRLPPPDLLKIDVEGYELHALRGLKRTVRAAMPLIFLEMNSRSLGAVGHTPGDVVGFLEAVGYDRFYDLDGRYPRPLRIGETFNALALSRLRLSEFQRRILARFLPRRQLAAATPAASTRATSRSS